MEGAATLAERENLALDAALFEGTLRISDFRDDENEDEDEDEAEINPRLDACDLIWARGEGGTERCGLKEVSDIVCEIGRAHV